MLRAGTGLAREAVAHYVRRVIRLIPSLALCALLAAVPGAAPAQSWSPTGTEGFRIALSEYNAGHFGVAERLWRALAQKGDPASESALGFMLYKGIGVAQSTHEAAYWFARAANQGQVEAQFFLGNMYAVGDGVPRSNIDAHMWCELALDGGLSEALQCRSEVEHRMTGAEIDESYRRVAAWQDRPEHR